MGFWGNRTHTTSSTRGKQGGSDVVNIRPVLFKADSNRHLKLWNKSILPPKGHCRHSEHQRNMLAVMKEAEGAASEIWFAYSSQLRNAAHFDISTFRPCCGAALRRCDAAGLTTVHLCDLATLRPCHFRRPRFVHIVVGCLCGC